MTGDRFQERWVELSDGQAMCALINGNLGWLMYQREEGDAGYSSRNPKYVGPLDSMTEYYLDNGQRDAYPTSWAYDRATIEKALAYFQEHESLPAFIEWHDDSADP